MKFLKFLSNRINSGHILLLISATTLQACSNASQFEGNIGPVTQYSANSMMSQDPNAIIELAKGFERSGDDGTALSLYQAILNNDKADATAIFSARLALAKLYHNTGRFDEVASLIKVIELGSLSTQQKIQMVRLHIDLKNYDTASTILKTIDENSILQNPNTIKFASQVYETEGQADISKEILSKGLSRFKRHPELTLNLAYSFALDGNFRTALGITQDMLDSAEYGLITQKAVANIYALSGEVDEAKKILLLLGDNIDEYRYIYSKLANMERDDQAKALFWGHIALDQE